MASYGGDVHQCSPLTMAPEHLGRSIGAWLHPPRYLVGHLEQGYCWRGRARASAGGMKLRKVGWVDSSEATRQ